MIIVNQEGKIVLVNRQAETLFGYKREELMGNRLEILVPERFRTVHPAYRSSYFENPKFRPMGAGYQLFALRKDGTEFPVEISLSPLETEAGPLVSSSIRDVSERKKQEDIQRKTLEEINRRTQEANRVKSEFLANMSHELRTPLNAVIGFADFLLGEKPGPLNERQREYLNDILASGQHLLQLINGVLDLAKVESGKMEFFPEWFSLETAIQEVISVTRAMAREKSITLSSDVSPGMPEVTLDPQKFRQILYNLISNAIKFTGEGGTVTISAEASPDGETFLVHVADTGIGIKPEDLPKIFTEFQQLETGPARRFSGTGLGLTLVKRMVEHQGGNISVASEFGRGSTFTVKLPFVYIQQS
jgi:PAS domain S-box-containing protein